MALAVLAWPRPAAPQAATRTTLDSIGDVGEYSSVAIGADGLGLISYYDATNTALKVAHCSNVECTAATLTTLDDTANVGEYTSITIGSDGLGLISYYDRSNGNLKTAHCTNALCSAANIRTVDAPGDVGRYSSIVTGSDGRGLIGYAIGDAVGLKVAHCHDADCGAATITTHPGPSGLSIEWMIGNDGLGLMVHMLSSTQSGPLRAVHCSDLDCSAAAYNQLAPTVGSFSAGPPFTLTRGASGLGFVSYTYTPLGFPPVALAGYCVDVSCSSVSFAGSLWHGFSAVLGSDGFPMMATNDPYVLDCVNAGCSGQIRNRIDVAGNVQPSMALGADQKPLLSYWNASQGDLKVAHCLSPDCRETGADLQATAFMDLFFPIGLGSRRDLRGSVLNPWGPDPSAPGTELRLTVPEGLAVQGFTPGPPTCRQEGSDVVCSAVGATVHDPFHVLVDTLVMVPGPALLTGTVSVSPGAFDLDPSNNSMTFELPVSQLCSIDSDVAVQEGTGGVTSAVFTIRRSGSLAAEDSFYHFVSPGTATEGLDFQASSGVLTFAPGQETIALAVPIIPDSLVETDETFSVGMVAMHEPGTCAVTDADSIGTIVDDDAPVLSTLEVGHGSSGWHTVGGGAPPWTDVFRLRQEPYASYEVLVDGASADMLPFTIERLAADNSTVLSSSAPARTAAGIRWENDSVATTDNQHLRVRSTGCTSGCGADDVYRLRVYETTASIPRINNTNGQVSVVILQNTTSSTVAGHVRFWSPAGALVATSNLSLGPRATMALNTTQFPGVAGAGGSVTVSHDGPYAALAGKAVALEPATGFSFDSPLVNRPR